MTIKEATKNLWQYLCDAFEIEDIENGFKTIEGFEYEPREITAEMIENLSDDAITSLLFDIGYMAVNELFGGDWGTWNDVLESLDMPEEALTLISF